MSKTIEFRRKNTSGNKYISHNYPSIKLEFPRGTIVINKDAALFLEASENAAVMFSFNKKEKCGYIYKEEPQDDSYYLKDSGRGYLRFTSKALAEHMKYIFDIPGNKKNTYFKMNVVPDKKGRYLFICIS